MLCLLHARNTIFLILSRIHCCQWKSLVGSVGEHQADSSQDLFSYINLFLVSNKVYRITFQSKVIIVPTIALRVFLNRCATNTNISVFNRGEIRTDVKQKKINTRHTPIRDVPRFFMICHSAVMLGIAVSRMSTVYLYLSTIVRVRGFTIKFVERCLSDRGTAVVIFVLSYHWNGLKDRLEPTAQRARDLSKRWTMPY